MSIANAPLLDFDTALALVRLSVQARKEGELELAAEFETILDKCEKQRRAVPHHRAQRKVWP